MPLSLRIVASLLLALVSPLSRADKLNVVMVGPLTGQESAIGRAYANGVQIAFDAANKAGGVNGNTFSLQRANDGGRATETVSETRRLLAEARPIALTGYMGDEPVQALLKSGLLEQERLPLLGYKTVNLDPEHPLVFNVHAGTRLEVAKLVQHMKTVGLQRIALFHEDGAKDVQAEVESQLNAAGLKLAAHAGYPAGSARADAAAQALLGSNAQAILMVSTSAAAAAFIESYRTAGGTAQLFAHSAADLEQLSRRLAEEHTQHLAIAQVVPNPYKATFKLSRELTEAMASLKQADTPVSFSLMEGYIAGRVILEASRRLGGRVSREGLSNALDNLGALDLSGLRLSYAPGNHSGSKMVELSIVNREGKIKQ